MVVALARGSLGGVRDRGWRESGDGSSYAKKNDLKPWLKQCWCIPPKSDAQFAYAMEDILEVYHRECQDDEVLVCMDETHRQQVKEVRVSRPAKPGTPEAYD